MEKFNKGTECLKLIIGRYNMKKIKNMGVKCQDFKS